MSALISISGPDPRASVTALFNFLTTPAGQAVVEDLRAVNKAIFTDLAVLIHGNAMKNQPAQLVAKPEPG